jgi:pilus assembly protein CpaB
MRNKKKLIVLLIQIILILMFVFTYKQYVEFSLQPTEVYMYARNLDVGIKVTERDLITTPLSQMTLQNNMILAGNKNEVLGKYTTVKAIKNTIVYREQLGDISTVDKFASLDLSNSRVIALPASYETTVAGDLERGDRIDLMYTNGGATATTEEGSTSFAYAKIFMQNIPIYQLNTSDGFRFTGHANQDAYVVNDDGTTTSQSYDGIASISLIVTPEQAEEIHARLLTGSIVFVKRFEESETHETLGFVIGEYGKLFAGNANAETGNIQVSDAFLNNGTLSEDGEGVEDNSQNIGTGNMEID